MIFVKLTQPQGCYVDPDQKNILIYGQKAYEVKKTANIAKAINSGRLTEIDKDEALVLNNKTKKATVKTAVESIVSDNDDLVEVTAEKPKRGRPAKK